MGVVIEREIWEPKPMSYVFLFASCFASISLLPYYSRGGAAVRGAAASSLFDLGPTVPFLRFQRSFLLLYSLASVMEGLESVFGEYEYTHYGISREQMAICLAAGAAAALFLGSFSGILSDVIGPRRACVLFCILHLLVGVLKSMSRHPSIWVASVCLSLASSVFSFCFETWMVTEHEKQGHKQDLLSDTFWLMTFFESACLVGSQGLANLLFNDFDKGLFSPSAPAALLAIISILYIRKEWNGCQQQSIIGSYRKSFSAHVLNDKRIWLLSWAQSSIHFSMSVFWILWAPTMVGDGREVHLSRLYPCFIGSRMLGSTAFPWFLGGVSSLRNEEYLICAYVVAGLSLLIVSYDYQEIDALVILFCIYHACVGFILPSLARLRTMYIPNELRGGMISFSLAPANAAICLVLLQGGYHWKLANSMIMALAALGLLAAAGCIHVLRWWRKQPCQNWHKS
ncbi:molybdate-anion transporter [Cocos nucifera]|nr:molybdate-anion transporter [Cocos nucifera]